MKKQHKEKRIPSIHRMIYSNTVILVLVVTLAVTAVGSIMYYDQLIKQTNMVRIQRLQAVADRMDTSLSQAEYCSRVMVFNHQLREKLVNWAEYQRGNSHNKMKSYLLQRDLRNTFNDLRMTSNIYAVGVYLHELPPQYFLSIMQENLYDLKPIQDAVDQVRAQPDQVRWVDVFALDYHHNTFAIVRSLRDENSVEAYGEIALLMEIANWDNINMGFSDSPMGDDSARLYLVDKTGRVLLSNHLDKEPNLLAYGVDEGMLAQAATILPTNGNGSEQVSHIPLKHLKWQVVEISDHKSLMISVLGMTMVQPLVAFFCLLLALVMVRSMSRRIDKPLQNVMCSMKRVADGELDACTPDDILVETNQLTLSLQQMVTRMKNSRNTIYEKEIKQKEAEFFSLQAQINPHFFYNTLETINMLLQVDEKYELSELVVNLADILRFNISSKATVITVREEIELVEKYLVIMRARFADKLICHVDCTAEALESAIVKFLIQPLVENAIQHGLEDVVGECHITITARVEADRLLIAVEDDGKGVDPLVAKSITQDDYRAAHGRHNGVGLHNIIQRIRLYYGGDCGLHMTSCQPHGTRVALSLLKHPPQWEEGRFDEDYGGGR